MSTTTISPQLVAHIAALANLQVAEDELQVYADAFAATLEEVDKLFELDVTNVEPTHHATGLVNVWRPDVVDNARVLTQVEALSQAPHAARGYFVVDRILEDSV